MHVVHVTSCLGDGGAQAVLYRLCSYDAEHRHTVISLSGIGRYGALLQSSGARVLALDANSMMALPRVISTLAHMFKQLKPDVVQTWMYHGSFIGSLAAYISGCRTVVWGIHHAHLRWGQDKWSTILVSKAMALASGILPERILVCSPQAGAAHVASGYKAKKITVITNGYDLKIFRPDKDLSRYGRRLLCAPEEVPLIGMVARCNPTKDHSNLLKALGILRRRNIKFLCVLVGSGMDRENKKLGEEIHAAGVERCVLLSGQRNEMPLIMNALDIHVLSSQTEAFPNVVAEAMACGTPCVATDVGDTSLIIGDTGWLVAPKNEAALADAIENALREASKPAWAQRRSAVRKRIEERFDIAAMVSNYTKVWEEVVDARR
jgi:glycosyltransferase involved in cell wall biosynthesis